jgi:oxygen-independent coproporphyrinogen-3 oxidase
LRFVGRVHPRYLLAEPMSKVEHLYVHVPFCAAKCHYCAFYSEAGNAATMARYVDALLAELEQFTPWLAPTTIFFGGGTPSLLPVRLMRRIFEKIPASRVTEWTVECNPSTVSAEKAKLFREFGVNRISMGVQAFDDDLLARIGRVHSAQAAIGSYEKLRAAGFDNINFDLMFALPGQTLRQWRATLQRAIELQPEHISTYCLTLEEDTRFWSLFLQGGIKPDEELELKMYELAIETLGAAGYRQYEISNFARPGRQCAHNIAYWEGKDYLGLGPAACSTVGNRRWQNLPDTARYIEALAGPAAAARRAPLAFEETLPAELRAAERVAFGLRMTTGIPAELLQERWQKQLAELLSLGLLQWRNGRVAPTRRGLLFADSVAAEFV